MTLPHTSPTKATYGVAIVYAGVGRNFLVRDRRPAPTKATPPRPLQARFTYPKQPTPSAYKIWGTLRSILHASHSPAPISADSLIATHVVTPKLSGIIQRRGPFYVLPSDIPRPNVRKSPENPPKELEKTSRRSCATPTSAFDQFPKNHSKKLVAHEDLRNSHIHKMRHRRILIRKSPWFVFFTASPRGNARPGTLRHLAIAAESRNPQRLFVGACLEYHVRHSEFRHFPSPFPSPFSILCPLFRTPNSALRISSTSIFPHKSQSVNFNPPNQPPPHEFPAKYFPDFGFCFQILRAATPRPSQKLESATGSGRHVLKANQLQIFCLQSLR